MAAALERFDQLWRSSGPSYVTDEQARYDENAAKAAIEEYLTGTGHRHGRNAIATDTTLGFELDGVRYEATVDAVVERTGRYLAIEYVPNMNGILNVGWYDDNVRRFNDGEGFYPRQIGSFAKAAIALRSLLSEYGLDSTYDFAYVSLLGNSRPAYEDADEIRVDVDHRHFQNAYSTEEAEINALVEERAGALLDGETDPREWRFDEITGHSCDHCAYRNACPDYIASEMSFTDRRQAGADEPPVEHPVRGPAAEESR